MSKRIITKNSEETKKISGIILKKLLSQKELKRAGIVALSGELGSGKTTLVQGLARLMGVKEKIHSPTFVFMKIYKVFPKKKLLWKNLVHIDAYRFRGAKEAEILGVKEIFKNRQNLVVIEWPEKLGRLIPKNALWIEFLHRGENHRHIFVRDIYGKK
ncbi:MAG: tRNA (adenosine(37)-N6)-threonylcarbamoyltransferase complex ATPase subunit type 1 TsaE [bacterium]|nr:tRNA (adenosine(37)-N6)-threonylcarbamoyltransferase complex ATPase subunit type 1 TsaE [bacterium]